MSDIQRFALQFERADSDIALAMCDAKRLAIPTDPPLWFSQFEMKAEDYLSMLPSDQEIEFRRIIEQQIKAGRHAIQIENESLLKIMIAALWDNLWEMRALLAKKGLKL